jgi:hypothetical protein
LQVRCGSVLVPCWVAKKRPADSAIGSSAKEHPPSTAQAQCNTTHGITANIENKRWSLAGVLRRCSGALLGTTVWKVGLWQVLLPMLADLRATCRVGMYACAVFAVQLWMV